MIVYMATLLEAKLVTCDKSWSSKKLDSTLNRSLAISLLKKNQDPTSMIVKNILMVSRGSKAGTLPPCWDVLPWVGLRTLCELVFSWPTYG